MSIRALLQDHASMPIVLFALGILIIAILWIWQHFRKRQHLPPAKPLDRLDLKRASSIQPTESGSVAPDMQASANPPPERPFRPVPQRPSLLLELLRLALIILALVVAAGFTLALLPQVTVDNITRGIQQKTGIQKQEQIALLYLGDEVKDQEFHVRGIIRNISTQPIEKLDATIRLYGASGFLEETDLVRMSKDLIAPDDTAEFHLVYPKYDSQFATYAVDFKLRLGDIVAYKDMRESRSHN
jgi:hypothetical protein